MAATKPVVIDLSEASESSGLVFASNYVLIVFAVVALSVEASEVFFAGLTADAERYWWDRYVAGPGIAVLMGGYLWLAVTMDYSARYWRRHALLGAVFAALSRQRLPSVPSVS